MPTDAPVPVAHRSASPHYLGLDVLRFIAAAMVAVMHLNTAALSPETFARFAMDHVVPGAASTSMPPPWVYVGTLGVQVFFVISGFLISQSAVKSRSATHFLTLRAIRLLPALWICSVVGFVVVVLTGYTPPWEACVQLLRSLVLSPIGKHIDDVVWTLVLEITFYAGIALLLAVGRAHWMMRVAALMAAVSTVYWLGYFACDASPSTLTCFVYDNRWLQKITSILLVQHGAFFALGITICAMTANAAFAEHRFVTRATLVISLIGACLQVIWVSGFYAARFEAAGAPQTPWLMLFTWLAFLGAILKFSFWPSRWTPPANVVSFIRLVGLASYPLYLSHNTVGALVLAFASEYLTHNASIFLAVLSTALWSCLLVWAFEKPLQAWLKRRLTTPTPSLGQAPRQQPFRQA